MWTKRILITAALTALGFWFFGWYWPPYDITDIPERHGFPVVIQEKGCYMILKDGAPNCVDRFSYFGLVIDLLAVAIPAYAIAWLLTRRRTNIQPDRTPTAPT